MAAEAGWDSTAVLVLNVTDLKSEHKRDREAPPASAESRVAYSSSAASASAFVLCETPCSSAGGE